MKNLLILFLVFFTSFKAISQLEWIHDCTVLKKLTKTYNNNYVLIESLSDGCDSRMILLDSLGSEIFDLPQDPNGSGGGLVEITDVVVMPDSSLMVAILNGYDQGNGWIDFANELVKINKNLEVEQMEYPSFYAPQNARLLPLSNGDLIVYDSYTGIDRRKGNGEEVWSNGGIGHTLFDLVITSKDSLIWVTDDGLLTMDENGVIDSLFPSLYFEEIEITEWDGLIGVNNDSISLHSPSLDLIASYDFQGNSITDFSIDNGIIAVLTDNNQVYIFNDSLHIQDSFQFSNDGFYEHLSIHPDKLVFAGTETYGSFMPSGGTSAGFIKDYSFSGNDFGLSNDIGVIDIQHGQAQVITLPNYYEILYEDIQVSVENFGENIVNEIYVRFRNPSPFQISSKKYTGISLQPNETVTLAWNNFKLRTYNEPMGYQEICLWTSHPDGRLDENSTNDGLCIDFLVFDKEIIPTVLSWNIFPNPVYDYLNIQLEDPIGGCNDCILKVTDISGRERYRSNIDGVSPNHQIPVWDWEAGLYFIQYLNDDGLFKTSRFVVVK